MLLIFAIESINYSVLSDDFSLSLFFLNLNRGAKVHLSRVKHFTQFQEALI